MVQLVQDNQEIPRSLFLLPSAGVTLRDIHLDLDHLLETQDSYFTPSTTTAITTYWCQVAMDEKGTKTRRTREILSVRILLEERNPRVW
jgi:hypothetical protein